MIMISQKHRQFDKKRNKLSVKAGDGGHKKNIGRFIGLWSKLFPSPESTSQKAKEPDLLSSGCAICSVNTTAGRTDWVWGRGHVVQTR
jgi:hypothetical protein